MHIKSLNRLIIKAVLFLIIVISTNTIAVGQQKPGYTLLWEISGNGLKKPSFLFGSMHLKDKRLFNFSDSVMLAIQASDAFVLEVHPDSLSMALENVTHKYVATLTDEQSEEVIRRYKAQSGNEPDSAMLMNAAFISAVMTTNHEKEDDMAAVIDAYLYGIAKTLKKKFFGLEDHRTQLESIYSAEAINALFDTDEEEEKAYTEEMINIYAKGSIDEIWEYVVSADDGMEDLARRNNVMADGIKKLMQQQTLFATVGAAHLSGDEGLINLLKKAGYKLRPVTADFTGIAKTYQIDYAKMDWYNYKDSLDNFSVDFPSLPIRTQLSANTGSVSFTDLITEITYTTTAQYIGPLTGLTTKQYVDTIMNIYLKNVIADNSYKKSRILAGADAMEVSYQAGDKFARTLFVYSNKVLYSLSIESRKDNIKGYVTDHFFDSFKTQVPQLRKVGEWVDFKDREGGFSAKFPYQPENIKKEAQVAEQSKYNPYVLHLYLAADKEQGSTYIIRYNDQPEGLYLNDKAKIFEAIIGEFLKKGKEVNPVTIIEKDGAEGRAVAIEIEGFLVKIETYIRGNRTFVLLRQRPVDGEETEDQFFSTFKFEAPGETPVVNIELGGLNATLPGKPFLVPNDEETFSGYGINQKAYYAVNKNTGGVYGLLTAEISKYLRSPSADSLVVEVLKSFLSKNDGEVKYQDATLIGGIKARELNSTDSVAGTRKRLRVWLNDNKFFIQMVIASKEEMNGPQSTKFFANISQKANTSGLSNLVVSKSDLLLKDLQAKDTTVFKIALGALNFYEFDSAELPALRKALKVEYANDTNAYGVRGTIISDLKKKKDREAIPFLKDLYADGKTNDEIRILALVEIPAIDSLQYDWYFNALLNDPVLESENRWKLFRPLSDSLSYAAKHIDGLMKLMGKDSYESEVLSLMALMINKDSTTYSPVLATYKDQIGARALQVIDKFNAGEDDISMLYNYLDILPVIYLPKVLDEFTAKVFAIDSVDYLHAQGIRARVQSNLEVDPIVLTKALDSIHTRYVVMEAFYKAGKLDLIPLKYREHEEFSKLMLYNFIADAFDYGQRDFTLLGTVSEADEIYYVFYFADEEAAEDGTVKTYIGIAGPFTADKKKLDFPNHSAYTDLEPKQEDWKAQAKAMIAAMKENME